MSQEGLDRHIPKRLEMDAARLFFIGELNQTHDRKGFHALFSATKSHSLGRLSFDVDSIRSNIENSGKGPPHGVNVRGQLRSLSNDSRIQVVDPPACLLNPIHHFLEHQETIGILERRIIVRKVLSYIPFPESAKQCVDDGMSQDVRIRVPQQTRGMGDEDPSQDQRATCDKTVSIIPKAYATHAPLRSRSSDTNCRIHRHKRNTRKIHPKQ